MMTGTSTTACLAAHQSHTAFTGLSMECSAPVLMIVNLPLTVRYMTLTCGFNEGDLCLTPGETLTPPMNPEVPD